MLNQIENLLILASTVTGCVLIAVFVSLASIPVGIMSSVVELEICTIAAGIKKSKSIIQNKRDDYDKIASLA